MDAPRLAPLDHRLPAVAAEIRRVMVAGYRVEAALLGVEDFVPLRRTAAAIAAAPARFLGAFVPDRLAAVAEIETAPVGPTNIASLVVHPEHFRKGLGTALVREVVATHGGGEITVSTGIRNQPALLLYARLGFRDHRRWRTDDGIPMITLIREAGPDRR